MNWSWFIASQVVYGVAMSIVVINSEKVLRPRWGAARACRRIAPESGQLGGLA